MVLADALLEAARGVTSNDNAWTPKDVTLLISSLSGAFVGVIALIVSAINTSKTLRASQLNNEATIWQKANEVETKEIQDKLDRFHGPYAQMSGTNALLARDLRGRQQDSATFLLIEKLFDQNWLSSLPSDQRALLDELIANASALRKFIIENAKMVDSELQPYLSRVCAHYRVLELAHAGKLGTDPKPYVSRYVFPIQIEKVLALEVDRLEARKQLLRLRPGSQPPAIEKLTIPGDLKLPDWQYPSREHRDALNMPIVDKSKGER
ncbi:hypothetical protein CWS35_04810 [Bradyrhizobium sp. SK17]|uniref:hypothetical protein n=1 Tax=Bradyrhizobium sp. SK17 TaxID=2057741 RepID=UPI000C31B651|nr:hypothetical protein [Bradyrhizobium sp. SK17]AUC93699.1 hypothetical protein CWS35_04810 [Bradyrhizobium sp. SK17]